MTGGGPLQGRHVLFILLGAFGVIVLANLALAVASVVSFPGMEVRNGYIASQHFERDRSLQEQLGWQTAAVYEDSELRIAINTVNGMPAELDTLMVRVGRPTHPRSDIRPALHFDGKEYVAALDLDHGNWNVDAAATSPDGIPFRRRLRIRVPPRSR